MSDGYPILLLSWIMRKLIVFFSLIFSLSAFCQSGKVQEKALNNCVDYANQSAEEIMSVVKSIIEYYPTIHQKSSWGPPRYRCPVQPEEYYYNAAINQRNALSPGVMAKLNGLRGAATKIDEKCKALDTYHKLEDFKQDNFAKAETIISELQALVADYKTKQRQLQLSLEAAHKKLAASQSGNAYQQADANMLQQVERERQFIDSWTFNLKQDVHTGWPVETLAQSIAETDQQLNQLKKVNPVLKYPASSMWPHFQESLNSILETKRSGLDGYNVEAKKSDRHSNNVYMNLINYFNGTLVADYNTFLQFSERDGYIGLRTIKFVPGFDIRLKAETAAIEVKPFADIPRVVVKVNAQKTALTGAMFQSLSNYVDFINESWRQVSYMQSALGSFNSSASYFKTLTSFDRRAPLHFDYKAYKVPLSAFQKTVSDSRALPPEISHTLNEQVEVLLNILKEMDAQSASLQIEVNERLYEKDRLEKVFKILERQEELFSIWNDKKELLYQDLRTAYDAFPTPNPTSSWQVSGKALRELTDLNRDALFNAKAFYTGDTTVRIDTEKINEVLREVIAKEYDNMKGIDKFGRNNGLCPYTPYEDLPETSRRLTEEFRKLKPAGSSSGYRHPYHSMVYLYNEIVDDYNKFSELSKDVYHLKTLKQPEFIFPVKYPNQQKQVQSDEQHRNLTVATKKDSLSGLNNVLHSTTIRQNRSEFVHDTIYIEKRDTVYLPEPGDDLRSMEGYAANNMVLLLDVSGSMNTAEKLPLLKSSVLDMISMMRPEDKISIIAFSGKSKVLLASASFKEEEKIRKAINALKSSGKTDGNAGLKLAYKVADENYLRGGNNRIILATDGEFVLSVEVMALIEKFSREDIFLSVFNFGKGMGSSKSLENLAVRGKGNYESVSKENIELKLIREAKAKRKR